MTRMPRAARRRITQPLPLLRPVKKRRDPAIKALGFTCFRLVDGETAIELTHSTNSMFAFVALR
jgi:hypothetical protein